LPKNVAVVGCGKVFWPMPGEKSLWGEPDCIASKLGENIFNYLDSRAENARRHDENYGNLKS